MMRPIWRNIWKHTIEKSPINQCNQFDYELGMAMGMQEYAVHADYAHICKYVDADEILIRIIHI